MGMWNDDAVSTVTALFLRFAFIDFPPPHQKLQNWKRIEENMCENEIPIFLLKTYQASSYNNIKFLEATETPSKRQWRWKMSKNSYWKSLISFEQQDRQPKWVLSRTHIPFLLNITMCRRVENSIYHTENLDDFFYCLSQIFTHCLRLLLWDSREKRECVDDTGTCIEKNFFYDCQQKKKRETKWSISHVSFTRNQRLCQLILWRILNFFMTHTRFIYESPSWVGNLL